MRRLAILGASGHGKVVADCAECVGWKEIVFFDDAWPKLEVNGAWNVIGDTDALFNNLSDYDGVVIAIGDNSIRLKKHVELLAHDAPLVSIVHPDAHISQYVQLGIGSVVMAGAVINVDSKLGCSCIINTGATIDHDCQFGDGIHISPGVNLAGGVVVGEKSWIGIGATVLQLINIGKNVVVGAGSVVVKNVADNLTVAGVPARILNEN